MGTLYDLTLASRHLALSFLDLMACDCVTLGNHEFDDAPQGLARIFKAAHGL
jgi:2',3'-cyclic-nucleotide 2'-phosphodiesterase (5'-nucleotidase family)